MIHGLYEEAQGFVRVDISWQFYNFIKSSRIRGVSHVSFCHDL